MSTGASIAHQLGAVLKLVLVTRTERWSGEPCFVGAKWQAFFGEPQPAPLWRGEATGGIWELYPNGRLVRYQNGRATIYSLDAADDRRAPPAMAVKMTLLAQGLSKVLPSSGLDKFLGPLASLLNHPAVR